MIPRGQIHSSGPRLAAYLVAGKDGEEAELIEVRGVLPGLTIHEAFADMQAIAEDHTQAEKPFFHAHIRLPDNERLSREQWLKVADRMEKTLGFKGHLRAVAFHNHAERGAHMHIAWCRLDPETLKVRDPGLFAVKMIEEARKLEVEFGLRQLDSSPNPDRLTKRAKDGEFEQARRLETNIDAIRNGIRGAWDSSDGGPALQAALAERRWILAQGDRRDFVVVDERGGEHALGKRMVGVTAGEVRKRLGGEDFKRTLPTVEEAKDLQRHRQQEQEQERERQGRSAADRGLRPEPGRKRSGTDAGRTQVATTDGGMVAQQREAMRMLTREERLAQLQAQQRAAERSRGRGRGRERERER